MSTQTTPFEPLHLETTVTRSALPARSKFLVAAIAMVRRWQRRLVTRRQLQRLPRHLYSDIGRTPDQVQRELRLFFWQ